ncbi:MAG TPA: hypothetical protein VN451_00075 [Chitinophagaceae bacterium]|nr:hypothetical protein [Chitinophagaceae bacterium]
MADNPRNPQQYSDIPSSRYSGGGPNPASPSPGSSHNPSAQPQSTVPPTKIHLRNLLIGGGITIITSTVVFLITQNLKKPEVDSFLATKQATSTAWNSYVGYENIYTNNTLSISKNAGKVTLDSVLKEFKDESNKFQRDVEDLARSRKIDSDLKKVFARRLDNERSSMPVLEQYYANLAKINKNNIPVKEKKDALVNEMARYNEYVKGFYERAINDIQGIAEVLSKRYDQKFSINDFIIVQMHPQLIKTNDSLINVLRNIQLDSNGQVITPETVPVIVKAKDIIGNWNANGQVFTFEKNGKMAWIIGNGEKVTGTWKIENNKLRLDGTIEGEVKKGYWLFFVSDITENSFTIISEKDNNIGYGLVRIIQN